MAIQNGHHPQGLPHDPYGTGMSGRISRSLRRRRPDRSPINPFIKYTLFFVNVVAFLFGVTAASLCTYILVVKEKTVSHPVDFFFDPACIVCLIGSIIVFISFFGCVGSLREFIPFLKAYYIILNLVLILEILLIVFVFVFFFVPDARTKLGLYPENVLEEAVIKYRNDDDMQSIIDNIQEMLSCCGASYDDQGYLDWNKNMYFNCSGISIEKCSVPFSCCKIEEGDKINYFCGADMLLPNADTSKIYTQGCLKGLEVAIDDNIWIIGGIVIGVLLPEAIFIFCSKSLVAQIEEQMMKWSM